MPNLFTLLHRVAVTLRNLKSNMQKLSHLYPFLPTKNIFLIWQLARRDVLGRYKGSVLGIGWSLVLPLMLLATYTVVFRVIFKARWPGAENSPAVFALNILAGLVMFNFFAEVVSRAPRSVTEQPNLVKRVIFPLESLIWVNILSALFHALLGLMVLMLGTVLLQGGLKPSALAAPLLILTLVPTLLCLGWLMAGVGVFLRDLAQVVPPVLNMFLFLTPVLYPASALPASVQTLLYLNPLTLPIEGLRECLLVGVWPDVGPLVLQAGVWWVLAAGSYWVFTRLQRGFADQL
jgi:lipopolysaccharide transport system permease protein